MVLVCFFLVVVVFIPGYFYLELFKEERDIGQVDVENRPKFSKMIDESLMGLVIPGVLGQGLEFSKLKVRSKKELEIMKQIRQLPEIQQAIPKEKYEGQDIQIKPICLLMAYMLDIREQYGLTDEETERELEIILRAVPSYLDILI